MSFKKCNRCGIAMTKETYENVGGVCTQCKNRSRNAAASSPYVHKTTKRPVAHRQVNVSAGMDYCPTCNKHVHAISRIGQPRGAFIVDTGGPIDYVMPAKGETSYHCPLCGYKFPFSKAASQSSSSSSFDDATIPLIILGVLFGGLALFLLLGAVGIFDLTKPIH